MTSTDISLGEFVKQLTVRIHDLKLPMPFKDEEPWHLLFYRLKQEEVPGKPAFLGTLRFDWDARYPRSQELSEYIHALHFTGCVAASNPSYDEMSLNPKLEEIWSSQKPEGELSNFLEYAMKQVQVQFATSQ